MKIERHSQIIRLINQYDIETQEELAEKLNENGFQVTQATVSRDIREMRLVKDLGPDGRYHYNMPSKHVIPEFDVKLRKIFRESVTSYAIAQNIVVLKTLPGLASAACSALDTMKLPHFVGSLAGDDTAFLAMTDMPAAIEFCKQIEDMLK